MALSLTRSSGAIKEGADSFGWLIECSSSGTSTGSWQVMPILADEEYSRDTKDTEIEDDSGAVVYSNSTLKQKTFKLNFLQTDKLTIDLPDEAEGKYYLLWIQRGTINGKNQEWAGFVKISGKTSMSFKDVSKIGIEFKGQKNQATMTIAQPATTAWATQIVIPIYQQFAVAETAVS